MAELLSVVTSGAEHFPGPFASLSVTDELNKILHLLREAFPDAAQIGFDFDGLLHVHIDVRKLEQVTLVQAMLPALGGGMFRNLSLGRTPNHAFLTRVSALVDG